MQEKHSLSPVEKRKLDRSIIIVSRLSRRPRVSDVEGFIMRARMRYILEALGAQSPSRVMVINGLDIMKDGWPFKIRRLRKLINGRRRQ